MSLLPEDTTKPSRINRRRKRRWKKTGLTNYNQAAMLNLLSQKTKAGIGVLNVAAQPQTCGFFVPNAQLSIMAGWAEQPKGWPVASPVRQLRSVRHPMIGVIR